MTTTTALTTYVRWAHQGWRRKYHPYFFFLDTGAVCCTALAVVMGIAWTDRPWLLPLLAVAVFYFPGYPAWLALKRRVWGVDARSYLTDMVVLGVAFGVASGVTTVGFAVGVTYLAVVLPLAAVFARAGCLTSGCCFGRDTASHSPLTITYDVTTQRNADQWWRRFRPGHLPTGQVYAIQAVDLAINASLVVAIVGYLLAAGEPTPQLLPAYLVTYSACRFGLEPLRGHRHTPWHGILTHAQVMCLVIISVASGAFLLFH